MLLENVHKCCWLNCMWFNKIVFELYFGFKDVLVINLDQDIKEKNFNKFSTHPNICEIPNT